MMEFESPGAFAAHLRRIASAMPMIERRAVHDAGRAVQREAYSYIGHYQEQAGPFQAWAPLAVTTLEGFTDKHGYHPGKVEMGFAPPDNPLLRTAELQHGIELSVSDLKFVVGVASQMVGTGTPEDPIRDLGEVARDLEFGTRNMEARSFLGRALFSMAPHIVHMIGHAVQRALAGHGFVSVEWHELRVDPPF